MPRGRTRRARKAVAKLPSRTEMRQCGSAVPHRTGTPWTRHGHATGTPWTRHGHATGTPRARHGHATGTPRARHGLKPAARTAISPALGSRSSPGGASPARGGGARRAWQAPRVRRRVRPPRPRPTRAVEAPFCEERAKTGLVAVPAAGFSLWRSSILDPRSSILATVPVLMATTAPAPSRYCDAGRNARMLRTVSIKHPKPLGRAHTPPVPSIPR